MPIGHSGPCFTMLPIILLDASSLLLFILSHISHQRTGRAFKTSLTEANPVSTHIFSKGTLTHQTAQQPPSHERSGHEKAQQHTDESNE